MNSKHLLSASGDILGEKVAGSINQGLKRNPWYCNPGTGIPVPWKAGAGLFSAGIRGCTRPENIPTCLCWSVCFQEGILILRIRPQVLPKLSQYLIGINTVEVFLQELGKIEQELLLLVQKMPSHGTPCSRLNYSSELGMQMGTRWKF